MKKVLKVSSTVANSCGMCKKCCGAISIVLGILIMVNSVMSITDWATFIAVILIVYGIYEFVSPKCPYCSKI